MRALTVRLARRDSARTMPSGAGWVNVARFAQRAAHAATLALALTFGPGIALPASAQEAAAKPAARAQRAGAKGKRARAKATAAAKPKSTPAAEKQVEEAAAPKPERAAATPAAETEGASAEGTAVDTTGEVRSEGDTQVKVMEFSGLDIEGQLKTPQMLYFLNRLRAEFGRPRLPHRSFMPELQRGTQEQSQR
jgi:hypothetical protein